MALVPNEGNFKDLGGFITHAKERISQIDTEIISDNMQDEKRKRLLVTEREMLLLVCDWVGLKE